VNVAASTPDAAVARVARRATGDRDWPTALDALGADGKLLGSARVRLAVAGDLAETYPVGLADVQIAIESGCSAHALAAIVADIFASNQRCRRVVDAAPAENLAAIALAEEAGFRYVVDVDTHTASYSLLVSEPEWVLAQPSALEDIPLEKGTP
jgi:hypothetical protein